MVLKQYTRKSIRIISRDSSLEELRRTQSQKVRNVFIRQQLPLPHDRGITRHSSLVTRHSSLITPHSSFILVIHCIFTSRYLCWYFSAQIMMRLISSALEIETNRHGRYKSKILQDASCQKQKTFPPATIV